MSVSCSRCGKTWRRDPALEVPCPTCQAKVGQKCRRPSGHPVMGGAPHAARDRMAIAAGWLTKCPGSYSSPPEHIPTPWSQL